MGTVTEKTINGTTVRTGDTVRATVEGKVTFIGSDVYLNRPDGEEWWIDSGHQVQVTQRALPDEPKMGDAVVDAFGNYGSRDRFVKRGTNVYRYLNPYTGDLSSTFTWAELHARYKSVVELGAKAALPKDHKVRDLRNAQGYKRSLSTNQLFASATSSSFAIGGYAIEAAEAQKLAWDILKFYGQVQ